MSKRHRKPSGARPEGAVRTLATGVLYGRERDMPLAIRPWLEFTRTTPRQPDGSVGDLEPGETFWANAHYLVHRHEKRNEAGEIVMVHLSMRTVENDTRHDWREMMRVKDELCGPDWEAVEMYPSQDRVVDTANQYHLFCFVPQSGLWEAIRQIGFNEGRHVYGEGDEIPQSFLRGKTVSGYVQRPL